MADNLASAPYSSEEELAKVQHEERLALARVVHAFRDYHEPATWEVNRWEHNYSLLSQQHKRLLPAQDSKIKVARRCIHANQFFLNALLLACEPDQRGLDELVAADVEDKIANGRSGSVTAGDIEKVRYVLKNVARDWSAEGSKERSESYGRILEELKRLFPSEPLNRDRRPAVLVPGAGLARLCCEVVGLGFSAQGNEFSYFMLLASQFILNHTVAANQWVVHPWLLSNCNQLTVDGQLRDLAVPDKNPAELVGGSGLLSMCAGDFVEVYKGPDQKEAFDCVATCFFIDTAHNIIDYLETIYHVLRPGGYWVNLGPLLWHWADSHTYLTSEELSIEVSLDEVKSIATALGFKLVREELVDAPYMADVQSMYKTVYQASFFTMIKIADNKTT